jgi:NAD(P)H-hydrate epimerase
MSVNTNIPAITTEQMREVDRLMIESFHIELIQMMENAGYTLAKLTRKRFLDDDPRGKNVHVYAGKGGNGGGGLVAARRLSNWGAEIQVILSHDTMDMGEVPKHQLEILQQLGIPIVGPTGADSLPPADLILDALIGYSLRGAPRGTLTQLIRIINQADVPVLSLDVPSGVDASQGNAYDPHIQATATLTLALPKIGLLGDQVSASVGELYLADISVPPSLYHSMGLDVGPIFAQEEIIRLA